MTTRQEVQEAEKFAADQRAVLARPCPNCALPLADGEVYRAGYDTGNNRTIPAQPGRGVYCDHVSKGPPG